MDESVLAIITNIGGRLFDWGFGLLTAPQEYPVEARIQRIDKLIQGLPEGELITVGEKVVSSPASAVIIPQEKSDIATACVACAVGHFSASSGLLKEALRFKSEGITGNEVLNRIAVVLEEQNALEREDLTPEKIQRSPQWEKEVAEEALAQSRQIRHRLEGIQSVDELEQIAADTKVYYTKLLRQWFKGRFGYLGSEKASVIAGKVG
jgi:hypothetical protein